MLLLAMFFTVYWASANQLLQPSFKLKSDSSFIKKIDKTQELTITVSEKGHVSLWDVSTGDLKSSVLLPQDLVIEDVQYNQTDNFVVAICSKAFNNYLLYIWDVETDSKGFVSLSKTKGVNGIRVNEAATHIWVTYTDNSIEYISLKDFKPEFKIDNLHSIDIQKIIFNSDNSLMIIPTDNEVIVYDINKQLILQKISAVSTIKITFSPNGESLLLLSENYLYIYSTSSWSLTSTKEF